MYEEKIRRFSDLNAWKEAYRLVILIYKVTERFPQKEIYALVSQMRRAVVSVSSNVAEGFSRRTRKEKIQFYTMAQGSLTELQNQIIIARGVNYLDMHNFEVLDNQTIVVHKLINGLIKGVEKIHNS